MYLVPIIPNQDVFVERQMEQLMRMVAGTPKKSEVTNADDDLIKDLMETIETQSLEIDRKDSQIENLKEINLDLVNDNGRLGLRMDKLKKEIEDQYSSLKELISDIRPENGPAV